MKNIFLKIYNLPVTFLYKNEQRKNTKAPKHVEIIDCLSQGFTSGSKEARLCRTSAFENQQ